MTISADINQFEPWELEAYLEGIDMPTIKQFALTYPDVWAAWRQNYEERQHAYQLLDRFDCPEPEQLRDYYWGFLLPLEQERIKAHLAQCSVCATELQTLVDALGPAITVPVETKGQAATPKRPPITQQIPAMLSNFADSLRLVVANLVSPITPALALTALRSKDERSAVPTTPLSFLFEAGETGINLTLQKEGKEHITLLGQVLSAQSLDNSLVKFIAESSETPEVVVALTEEGEFSTNQLRPGYYQIVFTLPEQTIVIPNILLDPHR